eukprot:352865-Chlamydomonas_euryale.AAC.4
MADIALTMTCKEATLAWLEPGEGELRLSTEAFAISGRPEWRLVVSGVAAPSPGGGKPTAIVCLAARCPDKEAATELLAHWGCSGRRGGRWHPPPAGWHTLPPVSYDAGHGAWQTPLEAAAPADPVHLAVLQLPLEDRLRCVRGQPKPCARVCACAKSVPWRARCRVRAFACACAVCELCGFTSGCTVWSRMHAPCARAHDVLTRVCVRACCHTTIILLTPSVRAT